MYACLLIKSHRYLRIRYVTTAWETFADKEGEINCTRIALLGTEVALQVGPSPGEPGLGWLRFGEFPRLVAMAATVATLGSGHKGIGCTGWCIKSLPLFEFPALAAAWQTDQPMHSQSADFGKFNINSLNLAAFFSLHPVRLFRLLGQFLAGPEQNYLSYHMIFRK